jgi:hypothetical protein
VIWSAWVVPAGTFRKFFSSYLFWRVTQHAVGQLRRINDTFLDLTRPWHPKSRHQKATYSQSPPTLNWLQWRTNQSSGWREHSYICRWHLCSPLEGFFFLPVPVKPLCQIPRITFSSNGRNHRLLSSGSIVSFHNVQPNPVLLTQRQRIQSVSANPSQEISQTAGQIFIQPRSGPHSYTSPSYLSSSPTARMRILIYQSQNSFNYAGYDAHTPSQLECSALWPLPHVWS